MPIGWLGPSVGSVINTCEAKDGLISPVVVITRNTVNMIRKMKPWEYFLRAKLFLARFNANAEPQKADKVDHKSRHYGSCPRAYKGRNSVGLGITRIRNHIVEVIPGCINAVCGC